MLGLASEITHTEVLLGSTRYSNTSFCVIAEKLRGVPNVEWRRIFYSLKLQPGTVTTDSVSSVQLLSRVHLFATPWTAACQASLSITNSWSLPKLMSIESVMPSNYLILCRPLLLPPSIFPSIRVFSNESVIHISLQQALFSLLCWPREVQSSIRVVRESGGLLSSYRRAKATSSRLVSRT